MTDEKKTHVPSAFTTREAPEQTISRASFGAGVGGLIGYLMGGWTGAALGTGSGLALAAMSQPDAPKGMLTEERKRQFEQAMEALESPEKLLKLAQAYEDEELPAHAELLRRKAALRKLTPEQAKKRGEWFLKVLASSKIKSVEIAAANFQAEGALGAARGLRVHAADLRAVESGDVDAKIVEHFLAKLMLIHETFPANSDEVRKAEANLTSARVALQAKMRSAEPPSEPASPPPAEPPSPPEPQPQPAPV